MLDNCYYYYCYIALIVVAVFNGEAATDNNETIILLGNEFLALSCSEVIIASSLSGHKVRDCTSMSHGNQTNLYWRIENKLNWTNARAACQTIFGADLISIHSFDEKRLALELAADFEQTQQYPNHGVWIGAFPRSWVCNQPQSWSDGSPMDYHDWLPGQPDCAKAACNDVPNCPQSSECPPEMCGQILWRSIPVQIVNNVITGWNDAPCCGLQKSICKLKLSG